MTKGIFIDLDGTLLNNQKQISSLDKEAIFMAKEKGFKVFLITGKSLQNSITFYKELELDTLFITSMGQVISKPNDPNFKTILNLSSYAQLKQGVDAVSKYLEVSNYLFETFEGTVFASKCEQSNLVNLIVEKQQPLQCFIDEKLDDVIGSYVEIKKVSETELKTITSKLNEEFENELEFSYWLTDNNLPIINIKPDFIGKSVAIDKIKEIEHIDYVISFGNGWNDRNMLKNSDEGYAMKNALEPVKAYAKYLTEFDNNNSGVGKQILEIIKNNPM